MFYFLANVAVAAVVSLTAWVYIPGGIWHPSQQVVRAAASRLKPVVEKRAAYVRAALPDWSKYTFQYQGLTFRGKKVLYVNAYCRPLVPPGVKLKHRVIIKRFVRVNDGGSCYFQAYYDPVAKKYLLVGFNGPVPGPAPRPGI
ncbi:MAG TPA: hypothetical protein EYP90_01715 [Chromatiaceae bacterium]|nr:hypothetical protein [Chromatiaceae bacterium]